jgi:hypothetical protein
MNAAPFPSYLPCLRGGGDRHDLCLTTLFGRHTLCRELSGKGVCPCEVRTPHSQHFDRDTMIRSLPRGRLTLALAAGTGPPAPWMWLYTPNTFADPLPAALCAPKSLWHTNGERIHCNLSFFRWGRPWTVRAMATHSSHPTISPPRCGFFEVCVSTTSWSSRAVRRSRSHTARSRTPSKRSQKISTDTSRAGTRDGES